MYKLLSLALLAGGIVLIVCGINAASPVGSDFSRLFTGSPAGKSMWLLIGGVFTAGLGVGRLVRGQKST